MRVLFKNQVVGLFKRWTNFLLVFCLLIFVTTIVGGAISTSDNVGQLFSALQTSGYYQSQITVSNTLNFSNSAFNKISEHFFNNKALTNAQKSSINQFEAVTVSENEADYQAVGGNFLTWLLKKELDNGGYYHAYEWSYFAQITSRVICQTTDTYNAQLSLGFDDASSVNQVIQHKVDKVVLLKGRLPKNEHEVVVTPGFHGLAIGNYLLFNQQRYQIVGTGFTLINYLYDMKQNSFIVPTVYFVNHALANYWLTNDFTSINQKHCGYYVAIAPDKFAAFMANFIKRYFQNARPAYGSAWATNFMKKPRFIFAHLQILVYFWVAILLFILTLLILVIFLKKELDREKRIWGILLGLGNHPSILAVITSLAYLTILMLPVLIGFGLSFYFQWYLTSKLSQVLLLFSQLVIVSKVGVWLNLVVIPCVLFLTLMVLLKWYFTKPVLSLINPQLKNKIKSKQPKQKHILVHWQHFIVFKWMLIFFKNNIKPLANVSVLFLFTSLFIFIAFNGLASYQYSQNVAAKVYQPAIAHSLISFNNPTFDEMLSHVNDNSKFSDNDDGVFQWIDTEQFQAGIANQTFVEINNLSTTKNFYHKYISSEKFAADLGDENFKIYLKNNFPALWQLIDYSKNTWAQQQKWPIITFGFKLYQADQALLFNTFNGTFAINQANVDNNFQFIAFNNRHFTKYFYYDNVAGNDSLAAFEDLANHQEINAILPLALARKLHVSVNDLIKTKIDDSAYFDASWNNLPLRITGINRDNYLSSMIIINQQSLVNFLWSKASNVDIKSVVNISDSAFLVTKLEILNNIGFYKFYAPYTDIYNFNLVGQPSDYFMTNIDNVINQVNQEINDFFQTLQFLITLIAIFAILVLFLLVFLIFYENQIAMTMMKLLGYDNYEIALVFSLPYLLLFMIILGINFVASYFLLQLVFQVLFMQEQILLLFHFSFIFTFSIIGVVLFSLFCFYLIAYQYIARQNFMIIVNGS